MRVKNSNALDTAVPLIVLLRDNLSQQKSLFESTDKEAKNEELKEEQYD